jgi:7-keto-8-aminopelargonate synthetase-like enzyme
MMLGSNDYLGLAGDPAVVRGATEAMETYGTGLAMNQPLATTPLHETLRERIAAFKGTGFALLFGSCTAANIALLTTLVNDQNATVFSDRNTMQVSSMVAASPTREQLSIEREILII